MDVVVMDQAISELLRRWYKVPAGVSRKELRRGMHKVMVVQMVGVVLWERLLWFAEMMRAMG